MEMLFGIYCFVLHIVLNRFSLMINVSLIMLNNLSLTNTIEHNSIKNDVDASLLQSEFDNACINGRIDDAKLLWVHSNMYADKDILVLPNGYARCVMIIK